MVRPDLTAVDCAAPSDFRRSASKSTHDRTRSDRSENCLVRSRGRSLSRHQRLALTFLRLPSPAHQGRIKARAGHLLRTGIATNYLLKLDAPRLTAIYPRPAIRARYCYRPKLMRGSLPGLQCGRVSVPCRAASSASHQGRRERFATSIRRQARQGDFRNVI
jgi:hypothetical protein